MLMDWLRSLFCRHQFEFVRNIYGDQINSWGGKRSIWACRHCGKLQGRDELHEPANVRANLDPTA